MVLEVCSIKVVVVMIKDFNRQYSIVVIDETKMKDFKYCKLSYTGEIHDLLAEELIKNNKILSYLRDNDDDCLAFLRDNLEDKLETLKTATTGFKKNDGVYMNFLAYEVLKENYGIEPLYLLQKSDIETPKFGVDSVFYEDENIWIIEFKTSTSKLNAQKTAKKIYEGVESLFCKEGNKIASLYECKTTVRNNNLNKDLLTVIQEFIRFRKETEKLVNHNKLVFNVCIVSPSGTFTDEEIKEYIKTEYIDCKRCEENGGKCHKYKCPRYENIKIQDAFHLQLPTDFSLEKLYNALIKKMEESNSESK